MEPAAPQEPAAPEEPVAPAAPTPPQPYTVEQLTQLSTENRATVLNDIVTQAYAAILDGVAKGKTEVIVELAALRSAWMENAEFVAELDTTLTALFPGSTVEIVTVTSFLKQIQFSYTPITPSQT